MKIPRQLRLLGALLGATLIQFCASGQTYQTTDYTNTFDNNGNTGLYQSPDAIYWYSIYQDYGLTVPPGTYNYPMTNDAAVDFTGDTNDSGSLLVYTPFDAVHGHDQNVFYFTFSGNGPFDQSVQVPMALVTNISFEIHVDPHSIPDPDGNFGTISVGLLTTTYKSGANSSYWQGLTIPGSATNGWVKLSETNAADGQAEVNGYSTTNAFGVDFDYNNYGGLPTNPVTFWIDNVVVLTSAKPPPPPPPPTMSISKTQPGLNLFAGQGTSLYQREDLETANAAGYYNWVGAGHPVTYSYTISDYYVAPGDAFQTQIFLVPNPGGENSPDWNEANTVFLDMESTANGASWTFRYKTNQPNGNSMIYGSGTLATINSSTAVGTWSVTFNNNTSVTMLAPDGTSTNFSIPDTTGATTALFDAAQGNNVSLYFGVQAGNAGGANDHIVVSDFKVTGLGAQDFDDNFLTDSGTLNPVWNVNANFPAAVQLLAPGDTYFLVSWTSPAFNFNLETSPTLGPTANWQPYMPPSGATPAQYGSRYTIIADTNSLGGSSQGYFKLLQQ